ncbi:hypothetical protein SDC9_138374 [bioreactor metagenome]|uniref:Uncharacterized protein n=1 Tax=bioreactor metagenome TaxID=1076179 RepID=A0A645DPJ9_9ZZZZ
MQLANNIIKEAAADDRKIILLRPLFGEDQSSLKFAGFLLIFECFVEIENSDQYYCFILYHRIDVESVQQAEEQHRNRGCYQCHLQHFAEKEFFSHKSY